MLNRVSRALLFTASTMAVNACRIEPLSDEASRFDASVRGAITTDISGEATLGPAADRQFARTIAGEPGVAATVVGLFSAGEVDVVSFYLPQRGFHLGTIVVKGLNSGGGGISAGAMYSRKLEGQLREVFDGVRGEIVIDSMTPFRVIGRFSFEADSSRIIPDPRTMSNGQVIPVLLRRGSPLAVRGSFAASRIHEVAGPR